MKDERVTGRVLLKRESGFLEGLGRDFRLSHLLLLLAAMAVLGGGVTAIIVDVARILHLQDAGARSWAEASIVGLAAAFFVAVSVVVLKDRTATVITDTGIMYAGMFHRWAEIRCCVMRKTRRGLVVWARSRRRVRMYFHGRDAEAIEQLFRQFCHAEALEP